MKNKIAYLGITSEIISSVLDYLYSNGFSGVSRYGMYNVKRDLLEKGIFEFLKSGKDVLSEHDKLLWQSWEDESDWKWSRLTFKDIKFFKKTLEKQTFFNIYSLYTEEEIDNLKRRIEKDEKYHKYLKSYKYKRRELGAIAYKIKEELGEFCVVCKSTEQLELDHINPLRNGGTNKRNNLQVLCKKHHKLKTKKDRKILKDL